MQQYRLSEICVSISDGDHLAPPKTEVGIPFVTISDISGNDIDFSDTMYVPESYYDNLDDKRKAKKDDILYSVVGSFGIPVFIKFDKKFCFQRHIAILRPDKRMIVPRYLYYTMKSPGFYSQADSYAVGAAQRTISLTSLRNMKVSIPSRSVQNTVTSILSAYDSLIENNQKRIKLLEQMAENLYKEWFVRFRFPGYEKENMKSSKYGSIPASFDVKTMGDVFEYYIGGGWGEEQQSQDYPVEASVIRGADFPNVWHYDMSSCPRRYHKISNYKPRQLEPGDLVFEISGGTSEQPVGRAVLATKELIERFKDKHVICASFCKLIRIKKDLASPYYFYYWLKYLYDTRIIDRFQLQSTGIINFKFESFLKKGTVILPPMDIMKQFDDSVDHLYCEMNNLAKQNDLLSHQRDLLLPRLMSGKLSI